MPKTNSKRITIASLGQNLEVERAQAFLVDQLGATVYRDAFLIRRGQAEIWLFNYGVLVAWDLNESDRQQFCYEVDEYIVEKYHRPLIEQYSYRLNDEACFDINHDSIELPDNEPLTRLALSHAFAQSAKLDFFEEKAQRLIRDNAYISKELARTGKVPLSRIELAKLRGVLFGASSDITLNFNLLDTPEFFWDYPHLEAFYQRMAKYLDLLPRVQILNKKLETIHELVDVLMAEQYHKHSAFLEIVIIVLIAVDIVIYFI